MVVVAIAGGTGDVGRMVTEEIVKLNQHQVYVLTRIAHHSQTPGTQPTHVQVDYDSVTSLSQTLHDLHVDTVISTLNLHWPGASDAQINLIKAAVGSNTVKRFVPSEFNVNYNLPEETVPYPPRVEFQRAEEELKKHPQLTYTLIRTGCFMDYLGLPYANTYLHPIYFILELNANVACIPGNGNQPVVFTTTRDLGRCVAALLLLPEHEWPRESTVVGEKITLNDLVTLAENVTGTKFWRTYDPLENIRKNITTELPGNQACYEYFPGGKNELDGIICTQMVAMVMGAFDVTGVELHGLFPDVARTQLEPFLRECLKKEEEEIGRS